MGRASTCFTEIHLARKAQAATSTGMMSWNADNLKLGLTDGAKESIQSKGSRPWESEFR